MSTYRFSYCPHCNKTLEFMKRSEHYYLDRYIGKKFGLCPNCKKVFITGKKFYNEMSDYEKKEIHFYNILMTLGRIFSIWAIFFILMFAFGEAISSMFSIAIDSIIFIFCIIPLLPAIPLGYLWANHEYKKMKEITAEDCEYENDDMKMLEINYIVVNNKIVKKENN